MQTSHGATMSLRMERLWRYVREVEKITDLHDFSTDTCVATAMPRLREALRRVDARVAQEGDPPRRLVLEQLRADLERVMRRVPANRVPSKRG